MSDLLPIDPDDQGVQGFVEKGIWNGISVVIKTSKNVDFMIELETEILSRLTDLNSPHFCNLMGFLAISPGDRRFKLILKEISHDGLNDTLANLIFENKVNLVAMINCLTQTMCAIIQFEQLGITHYDLHADNVMINNTNFDVHVYITPENDTIAIETFGITPVIIDFGMAYLPYSKYKATNMFCSNGFTTSMNDPLIDCRLLLMSTTRDFKDLFKKEFPKSYSARMKNISNEERNAAEKLNKNIIFIKKYIKQINKNFKPLCLKENGWFQKDYFPSVNEELVEIMPIKLKRASGILKYKNFEWLLELLQHELVLPLSQYTKQSESMPFFQAVSFFAAEWIKVEHIIRNTTEEQLLFKELVSILNIQDLYCISQRYKKIQDKVNFSKIRYYIMCMADAYYDILVKKNISSIQIKESLYNKLENKTTEQILQTLPLLNIEYKIGMKVLIIDIKHNKQKEIVITSNNLIQIKQNPSIFFLHFFDE